MGNYKVDGINSSNIKSLSKKENDILFKKFRNGDKEAKQKLIEGNLKLVLSIVKKYNSSKFDINDLFQVGCIGLIKAIDNFDPSLGLMLSTYACPLILGEVKRYIRDTNSIRITRSIRDLTYNIMKYKEGYYSIHGIYPKNEEIKKALNIEEYQLKEAIDSLKDPMSIYEPIYNDGGDTIYLEDQLKDTKNDRYSKEEYIALKEALKKLKKKEKEVLIERYIVGKTQMELAALYNVSQAQISRLEKSALNNIKKITK